MNSDYEINGRIAYWSAFSKIISVPIMISYLAVSSCNKKRLGNELKHLASQSEHLLQAEKVGTNMLYYLDLQLRGKNYRVYKYEMNTCKLTK